MHAGSGREVLYSAGMHNPSRHVSSMCETSSFSKVPRQRRAEVNGMPALIGLH